jgi:hypothetical protein
MMPSFPRRLLQRFGWRSERVRVTAADCRRRVRGNQTVSIENLESRRPLSAAPALLSVYGRDAIRGDVASQESVTVGGQRTSVVNHQGDQDWFRVGLQAGIEYRFNLNSVAVGRTPGLGDPFLRLHNAGGGRLRFNDNARGLNSEIIFRPQFSGTYFLAASGSRQTLGGYSLAVNVVPPPIVTNPAIALNQPVFRTVTTPGQEHRFPVYLRAGNLYRIDVDATSRSLDPMVWLRTYPQPPARPLPLSSNNDRIPGVDRNARIEYIPINTGWYLIDAGGSWGSVGSFRLLVTRIG